MRNHGSSKIHVSKSYKTTRRPRYSITLTACALLNCLGTQVLSAPKTQEKVHNEKVDVTETVLQPGESERVSSNLPSVTVYSQPGSFEVTPSGGKPEEVVVKRGEARYLIAQPRTIRNTGSSELRYVRVDFAGPGAPEMWGKSGLAPRYKLLFENKYARLYDIRIPAHSNEPQHTHHDRVVVCLSGATLKHLYPDGHEEPSTLKTGESVWRRGGTHIGQNLGDTDLWVIAIEPK
jgi:hypothetical protein